MKNKEMKQLFFSFALFGFLLVCTPSVFGQKTCSDYSCVIAKVKKAMANKNYRLAFEQLESAEGYNNKNAAEVTGLRTQLFNAIEKEKDEAKRQKQIADTATKRAENEAKNAKQEKQKAETAKKNAEKQARAAKNTAAFMKVHIQDPTLAIRMMQYNYIHHPENEFSYNIYYQTLDNSEIVFLLKILKGHSSEVRDVAFSPDGKKVVTGSSDKTAKLWDVTSGQVERTFVGHLSEVYAVAFSPDGKNILTGSSDNTAKLWNIASAQAKRTFIGHSESVNSIAFSPDGKNILTGSSDNTVKLWNIENEQAEKTLEGHFDHVSTVTFSPNGKKILTGSYDKTVRLWDMASGKLEKTFMDGYCATTSVSFSPDGEQFLRGGTHIYNDADKNSTRLVYIDSEYEPKRFPLDSFPIVSVAFCPDGKKVITVSDNIIKIWSVEDKVVEDSIWKYSLYEMSVAGLHIEPEDRAQYLADSTIYANKIGRDTTEYNTLIKNWESSDEYKAHLQKIKDLENSEAYKQYIEKIKRNTEEGNEKGKNIFQILQNRINNAPDTLTRYNRYGILIDTLQNHYQNTPKNYAPTLANTYNSRAWYGFFLKKFKECEADIRAGIRIDSTNKYLYTNLAPALLLQGKVEAAKAEYEKWKDKAFDTENNLPFYRDAFLSDLNEFEKAGIIPDNHRADVTAIRKLLKKKE